MVRCLDRKDMTDPGKGKGNDPGKGKDMTDPGKDTSYPGNGPYGPLAYIPWQVSATGTTWMDITGPWAKDDE